MWIVRDYFFFFFFQAEDGIRDLTVTGVQTCALPICARDCGARGGGGGPGAIAGESTPCPAVASRGALFAPRPAAMPALWLCLLWEAPQPQCPQGQAACVRLLPLLGHRCVPLRGGTRLSEYPGADGSGGPRRLAGSLYIAGAPRAPGGGISAPVAA